MDCATCSSSSTNIVLEPTTSRCLTKSIATTHYFEVTNFSLLDGIGISKFVRSGTFSVGGGDWYIRLYPDGEKSSPAHVSIFLRLLGGVAGLRCKLNVTLLDMNNRVLRSEAKNEDEEEAKNEDDAEEAKNKDRKRKRTRTRTRNWKVWRKQLNFEPKGRNWGWAGFIPKSTLEACLQSSNSDSFTIRCQLTIIKAHTEDMNTIVVPPPTLHHDLVRILRDGEGTDVALRVGGHTLHAHASILIARCAVFRALLQSETKEKATKQIQIEDMEPAVLEWLLYYIYTDSLPDCYQPNEGERNMAMQHLLVAADRYALDRLRLMCEERLSSWIDVESVATTLVMADQHQCLQLKDACLRFIAWREVLPAVMETEGFKHLTETCPVIMSEILSRMVAPDAGHS